MRIRTLLFLLLLFTSSVGCQAIGQVQVPESALPGEPLVVWAMGGQDVRVTVAGPDGPVAGPTPSFVVAPSPGVVMSCVILGLPTTVAPGDYVVDVQNDAMEFVTRRPLRVDERTFRSEEITLSETLSELREREDPQKTVEALELQAVVAEFNAASVFHPGPFVWPVPLTRRTSHFGDRRTYLYADAERAFTIHLGTDLAAATGTPVLASGRGLVRMARSRIVTGNSVVIEHLPGVFSLYYHLDEMSVEEGTMIESGQLIGTSGATGLATGPHLHWEFRIGGVSVDPESLLNRPLVDFEL